MPKFKKVRMKLLTQKKNETIINGHNRPKKLKLILFLSRLCTVSDLATKYELRTVKLFPKYLISVGR